MGELNNGNELIPRGVRRGTDGDYTCLVADDGTRIQICGVWYLDALTKRAFAWQNGLAVAVCSSCGCRVAFEDDRFCRRCGREFDIQQKKGG